MRYLKESCCCGCLSLRTASLLFGWLSLIGAVLDVIRMSSVLDNAEEIVEMLRAQISVEDCDADCLYISTRLVFWMVVCALAVNLVSCVLSAGLIYGATKDRPKMMTPYIMYHTSMLILSLMAMFAGAFGFLMFGEPALGFVFILLCAPFIGLCAYFLFVVKSHQVALETAGVVSIACVEANLGASRVYNPTTATFSPANAVPFSPIYPVDNHETPAYYAKDDEYLIKA